jgi:hypothetical protein
MLTRADHHQKTAAATAKITLMTDAQGLRLRVERDLREESVGTCRSEGKTAAQVLREYLRARPDNKNWTCLE